jgi:Flp pilus assembly protein TadG
MWEHSQCRRGSILTAQAGVAAVEFALVAILFFTFMFGIMELARGMYIFNTLQEVTRRAAVAAANADFSETENLRVRRFAIFRDPDDARPLAFAAPVTAEHIRIDYLAVVRTSSEPQLINSGDLTTPAENRKTCAGNPNDAKCVQLVRVQVCAPNTNCTPVPYQSLFSFVTLPVNLPTSTTIVAAETLGR